MTIMSSRSCVYSCLDRGRPTIVLVGESLLLREQRVTFNEKRTNICCHHALEKDTTCTQVNAGAIRCVRERVESHLPGLL